MANAVRFLVGQLVESTKIIATLGNIYPASFRFRVSAVHDDGKVDLQTTNGQPAVRRAEPSEITAIRGQALWLVGGFIPQ
jgi:hypothetical protein